jgi:DNA-binding CsgD family transcriptional regulator
MRSKTARPDTTIGLITRDEPLARHWRSALFPIDLGCPHEICWRTELRAIAELPDPPHWRGLLIVLDRWTALLPAAIEQARARAPRIPILLACEVPDPTDLRWLHTQRVEWLPPPLEIENLVRFVERATQCDPVALLRQRLLDQSVDIPPSERQLEIAERFARGQSREEIAREMAITIKTLERHVTELCRRSGTRSLTDLAQRVWAELLEGRAA